MSDSDTESRFVDTVLDYHRCSGRHDQPWRQTRDPYAVLVSEVMLQQTQVARVISKYAEWLERFPTPNAVAEAPLSDVLACWQGLGYNRRAVAFKRACEVIVSQHGGEVPQSETELLALPGVGPATAAGVRAFAFDEPGIYLETNVRAAFLHHFFEGRTGVADREVIALMPRMLELAAERGAKPRDWYHALLDYGVHLKSVTANPSRASKHHVRQSPFEGSRRQARAHLLRAVMERAGESAPVYAAVTGVESKLAEALLGELETEGFLVRDGRGRYGVA